MNPVAVRDVLAGLRLLPFFPEGDAPMNMLVDMVIDMAETEEQVYWLVRRMTSGLYDKWPGPFELRATYCSKFKPKDGIELDSVVYPEGIPSERGGAYDALLSGTQFPALPAGHTVSADPGAEALVAMLDQQLAIDNLKRQTVLKPVPPPPVPEVPPEKRITEKDIARALEQLREERARRELYGTPAQQQPVDLRQGDPIWG